MSYSITTGALGSHTLLLSCSIISLALHNNTILITILKSLNFQPTSKSNNCTLQVLQDSLSSLPAAQLSPTVGPVLWALLRLLPGQVWTGQGDVLETLVRVINRCDSTAGARAAFGVANNAGSVGSVGSVGCGLDYSLAGEDVLVLTERGAADTDADDKSGTSASNPNPPAAPLVLTLTDLRTSTKISIDQGKEVIADADVGQGLGLEKTEKTQGVPVDSRTYSWVVSPRGLVALLLREAGRST